MFERYIESGKDEPIIPLGIKQLSIVTVDSIIFMIPN